MGGAPVKRVDADTLVLTKAEDAARQWFLRYLLDGKDTPYAAYRALNRMDRMPTDEFIEWLSDGTCRRWGQRVLITPEFR